ncbi:MAG TPA: alpha/beta fold hydrolase [Aggregatilineales bacterium]|nr:alpha/beta fold hydrolase [Aggregatilineales bacterium]
MSIPTIAGITAKTISSARLTTRVLFSGPEDGIPVLFLHGNASSATYWEETMVALPAGYRGIAPDQRGYGEADRSQKIDATRGMGDLADDAFALLDTLGIQQAHVAGHSMGGSVIWRMMMDAPGRIISVTLAAPGSPYGFGGSKGPDGQMCNPDGAGSGGGIVNATFTQLMAAGDRGTDNPQASPRIVMNSFYWKPPFKPAREEELLSSLLSEHVGPQEYPGDSVPSSHWPMTAPGKFGPANALSPLYAGDVSRLNHISPKPPVLWVRGADDQIVSDTSLFDMGTLGAYGVIPGWPGAEVYPSQPMVSQSRAVLEAYQAHGGSYQEIVLPDTGHTPYIERPAEFNAAFHAHLKANG